MFQLKGYAALFMYAIHDFRLYLSKALRETLLWAWNHQTSVMISLSCTSATIPVITGHTADMATPRDAQDSRSPPNHGNQILPPLAYRLLREARTQPLHVVGCGLLRL
jgi:hypothetical protein